MDDELLERALRDALRAGDVARVQELQAEARRRFAGKMGLPRELMKSLE